MAPRKADDVRQVPTVVGPLWVDRWDQSIGKTLTRRAEYEPEWTAWLTRVIQPGMRVVDIGANLGYYTVLFGTRVGDHGRVLAFEPDPFNRDLLVRSVRDNGLEGRVTIQLAAVTDLVGSCRLHIDRSYRGLHSLSSRNRLSHDETDAIDVAAVTLDAALTEFGEPDFIKIDAQGAEGAILRGASKTLGSGRPMTLMLELWPFGLANCGSSTHEVLRTLERHGFTGARVKRDRPDPIPCSWDDLSARAGRLTDDHSAMNLLFTREAAGSSS
jgi:FkbM family methyltransferase